MELQQRLSELNNEMGISTSTELIERIRSGDERAAAELMDCYAERLVALARARLSRKLARRVDAEDIVQSACRSFFRQAQAGRYQIRDGDDLWRLLAAITVHKALRQAKRHSAAKRSMLKEESRGRDGALQVVAPEALAREPSPAETATFVEETQAMMASLSPMHRGIVELCLQGHDVPAIAQISACSERTVERALQKARTRLEQRLRGDESS